MGLSTTHPLYDQFLVDWQLMRDGYAGERVVKSKGLTYLPATPGQILDGMKTNDLGSKNYEAYKMRAVYHDYIAEAVEAYIGLLHQNPPSIELPAAMEPLREKATIAGETLDTFIRRINEQQLVTGRLGILCDLPTVVDAANPLPYLSMYIGEAIKDWDDSNDNQDQNQVRYVKLDESGFERDADNRWVLAEKYRILQLVVPMVEVEGKMVPNDNAVPVYCAGVFYKKDGEVIDESKLVAPMLRGKTLETIPFSFINSKDIIATPDNPPLLGLGNLSMTIYRGEADYRNQLFLQGQDTLIVIGGIMTAPGQDDAVRVGAGARIDVNLGGDAKYVGVSSKGLPEVRTSLENDKNRAASKSGQLATKNTGQVESGETLKTRLSAQTATLTQIAKAGAAGLEHVLRICAEWLGQDPNSVTVTPNLEFGAMEINGKEIVDLMSARTMGAPLSLESIHKVIVERGLSELTLEEELAKIEEEDAGRAKANEALGLDPNGGLLPDPNAPPAGLNGPASA